MNKFFISHLSVLIITANALFANDLSSGEHALAGVRMQHPTKTTAIQEQRALLSKYYDADSVEEEEILLAESAERVFPNTFCDEEANDEVDLKAVCAKMYHPASAHFLMSRAYTGETLELNDGSIWVVKHSDRHIASKWKLTPWEALEANCPYAHEKQIIRIVPNKSWFSSYQFKFVNTSTGESVRVNLSLGPIYNSKFTYWITGIDYVNRILSLNDGSVWNMSGFDSDVFCNWLRDDTIIIGTNDGWFSGSRPNILLNVNMLNYAKARCDY